MTLGDKAPHPVPIPAGGPLHKNAKNSVIPGRPIGPSPEPMNTGLWNMRSGLSASGRAPE